MPVTHFGNKTPIFEHRWDPSDEEWVWVSWEELINGSSIASSVWVLPIGWENNGALVDQSVSDSDGRSRANSNGVRLSTTHTDGIHTITNRVTMADGRSYERSVKIVVAQS